MNIHSVDILYIQYKDDMINDKFKIEKIVYILNGNKLLMKDYIYKNKKLIHALDLLEEKYRSETDVDRSRTYFNKIKPEVETYLKLLEEWGELAHPLSKKGLLAIFPQQIDATIDNMRVLIMHSYYKDVRKRRYMEMKQSCYYVFTQSIDGKD